MSWKIKKEEKNTRIRDEPSRPRGRGRSTNRRGGARGRSSRSRGRSRGGMRGRSRGGYRGRRRRGRGSYRGGARSSFSNFPDKQQIKKTSKPILSKDLVTVQKLSKPDDKEIEIIKQTFSNLTSNDIQNILLGESKEYNKVIDHVHCINYNIKKYIDKIEIFIQFKVFSLLSVSTKAKILTALLITGKKETIDKLLYDDKNKVNLQRYSVGEMAKVIQLLDAPRLTRQYLKKLQKFEKQKKKVQKQKIIKLKTHIYNLQKDGDGTHNGSLSGNKQKFFVKWIKSIDSNVLSFFLVTFPKTNWRFMCDLIHINPNDFQLPFFQKVIFNKQDHDDEKLIDDQSLVFAAKKLNQANITAALTKHKYLCECYSFIRKKVSNLPDKAKLILSETAPLSDLLWWYDEFKINGNNKDIENKICQRLETEKNIFNDNTNKSAYGKLMERLLKVLEGKQRFAPLLIHHIEERLLSIPRISNIDRQHEYRVAIFGDASASMEVAIKTASILSSLMSYALSSDLLFFNSQPFDPPFIPRNVNETIEVVNNTKAYGTTSMASALYPYYINKIKVDLFILVSDEDENRKYKGYYFAQLFNLYKGRINSECKLFLVSFLKQGDKGKLFERCNKYDIICKEVKQIRLHPTNPDTSKFDALLGIASLMLLSLKNASKSKIPQTLNEILSTTYDINDSCISYIIYDYLRGCSRDSVLKMYNSNNDIDHDTNVNNNNGKTGIKLTSKQIIAIPKSKMIIKCEMDTNIDIYGFIQCVQNVYGTNNKVEISNVIFTDQQTQLIEYQIVFTDENEAITLHSKRKQLNHEIADNLCVATTDLIFKNDKLCKPKLIDNFILQLDSDSSHILCGACLIYDNHDECRKVVHYGDRQYDYISHSGDTKVNGKSVHKIRLNLSKLILDKNIKQLFFTLCACGPNDLSEFKEPTILLYEETAPDINLIRYEIDEAGKSRSVVMCRIFKNNNCWNLQALGYKQWHIQQSVCGSYHHAKQTITKELPSLLNDKNAKNANKATMIPKEMISEIRT